MRLATAVPEITSSIEENLNKVLAMMQQASGEGADMVLFPEAVLTGLNISDDYETDLKSALPIDSVPICAILDKAGELKLWTAFGFLERASATIYDSAVLVDDKGRIVLHQQRMSRGWRNRHADPAKHGSGAGLASAVTPWGKTVFLICGDLSETAFPLAVKAGPDLLLCPFARCFTPDVKEPQKQWDEVEWPHYAAQIKAVGALTLMANYIAPPELNGGGFGGGFIVDRNGEIILSKELFVEGLVIREQPDDRPRTR